MPLPDWSVDVATVAFGIRNVVDPVQACRELHRVLVPGGQLAILEFGAPRIPGIRTMYLWYFRYVLPLVGRRDLEAFRRLQLPAGVRHGLSRGRGLRDLLRSAGFDDVRSQPLTFGIVWLYIATRGPKWSAEFARHENSPGHFFRFPDPRFDRYV